MAGGPGRRGLPAEHAAYVVDGLLEASLRGIDTHGVRLFPTYLAELDGGRSRARPELRWSGERAARTLDAGGALGLVAGRVAADEAVRLARELGVGAVSVRDSNHFGAASVYTLAMARQGVLGLAFTNSDALVAPHGGRRPVFGTNPISLAARGDGDDLFCADFATSQVSYSKVKHHRAHGLPLEPGWVVEGGGDRPRAARRAQGAVPGDDGGDPLRPARRDAARRRALPPLRAPLRRAAPGGPPLPRPRRRPPSATPTPSARDLSRLLGGGARRAGRGRSAGAWRRGISKRRAPPSAAARGSRCDEDDWSFFASLAG